MSKEVLFKKYPKVLEIEKLSDLPKDKYGVYILFFDNKPIVLGHGKRNRAKIILDNKNTYTTHHLKSIFVRLYHLYHDGVFERYYIACNNKNEAIGIEKILHELIGGNNRVLPKSIISKLFKGITKESKEEIMLKIALNSSYSGIADILKWRKEGIINDESWSILSKKIGIE